MPPKVKRAASDSDDDVVSLSPSEESEEYVPTDDEESKPKKKKGPAPKRAPAPKKKADEAAPPAKKPRQPKAAKITEPTTLPSGWVIHPPGLIYRPDKSAQGGSKIAAFDLDGTLVLTKGFSRFAKDERDWRWFNKHVPAKLAELVDDGYQLVIFTNQGGIRGALTGVQATKTMSRVENALADLRATVKKPDLGVQVFMATQQDEYRKPGTGMWEFFAAHANAGAAPDIGSSFFVGDAAGRENDAEGGEPAAADFADSDKKFAEALGLEFKLPEDAFGAREGKLDAPVHSPTSPGGPRGGGKAAACPENQAMADAFQQLADKYAKSSEENAKWKLITNNRVAGIVRDFKHPIRSGAELMPIKGFGKGSKAKVDEFLKTGTLFELGETGTEAAPADKAHEMALKFI